MNILQHPFSSYNLQQSSNTKINHIMLYQSSSSRNVRIPSSQLPAQLLTAHGRAVIGRSDVALTVRMKLDNTHWLPSDLACPLVNPPLKHLIYATLIIIVYIYDICIYIYLYIYKYIYIYIYIYRLCEIFMSVTDTHFQSCPVVFETVMPKQSWG